MRYFGQERLIQPFQITPGEKFMVIEYLADRPEFIPILASESARHWSALLPDQTVARRVARLESQLNREVLPMAWVAHADGEAQGTASLRIHDLHGREDLSPWLGGVFVREKFRRKGIAASLCEMAERRAWDLGMKQLYLFTLDQQLFYSRRGWHVLDKATWQGRPGSIMAKTPEH